MVEDLFSPMLVLRAQQNQTYILLYETEFKIRMYDDLIWYVKCASVEV